MKNVMKCMWHTENTPSMIIDLERKTFHCISCGAKGTIQIKFTRDVKRIDGLLEEEC